MQRRGYTFYTNAARKTRIDSGRSTLQRLAAEESILTYAASRTSTEICRSTAPWLKN